MTENERKEKLEYAHKRNSYTSPTIDDVDFDDEGNYLWDCCNSDYCEKFEKRLYNYRCMLGTESPRCSREEKVKIRDVAKSKGFHFPNDAK